MADLTQDQFTQGLNDDQKAFFTKALASAGETAVTQFKTTSEEARKKAIPEKYELKLADGTPLDANADVQTIATFAKENGMTQEQAQKLADHNQTIAKSLLQRQTAFVVQERENWKKQTETDKELGGEKLQNTLSTAKLAMDRFAPEGSALHKILIETGYGNHIEWVRLMHSIGKAMQEDKGLGGGGGGGKKKDAAHRLYPNLT